MTLEAQAACPGTSNTRALTPAGAQGPRTLQSRVDALTIAFSGEVKREQLFELSSLKTQATHSGAYSEIAGSLFEVCSKGGAGMEFRLRNNDATLLIGQDQHGMGLIYESRATYLAKSGISEACFVADEFAEHFLGRTREVARTRRVDLCVDVTGVDFFTEDLKNLVTRARKLSIPCSIAVRRIKGDIPCVGWTIGKGGDVSATLYDKTLELNVKHQPESLKVQTEHQIWREAEWDGVSKVWRLEVRLRGKAIDQFGVRDPWEILNQLDPIWRNLIGEPGGRKSWLRLVDPTTGSRSERQSVSSRWALLQGANFGSASKASAVRVQGKHGGAPLEQAVGSVLSYLASNRALSDSVESGPIEQLRSDLERLVLSVEGTRTEATYHHRRDAVRARFASLKTDEEPDDDAA